MTETDWAYLAGLIDGEGSIQISDTVQVRISNTDMGIIKWLGSTFPKAKIHPANSNTSYGYKLCLVVRWNGRNAHEILTRTLPYLQGKKRMLAEFGLEFLTCVDDSHWLEPEKKELRVAIKDMAAVLNSKLN